VFQAFLTTFLIDSDYKTVIENIDELFDSGIKLGYYPEYSFILEIGDEREVSRLHRNLANCQSIEDCTIWAAIHKNVSILLDDLLADTDYAIGIFVGDNSEPLLCKLKDGDFFATGLTMMMIPGDPLMRRVNEIVDRVVEAGLYNHWISLIFHYFKIVSGKIGIVQPLDEYYSFNLYHMQPAFYLLLMGWCLSALCFMVEVLYNRILSK
jgi:hypothetical protein